MHLFSGTAHLPSVSSARVLLVAWGLSVLVFTTTYSANLVAFLASVRKEYIVDSLETLGNHESLSITIKEGCPALDDFEVPVLFQMYDCSFILIIVNTFGEPELLQGSHCHCRTQHIKIIKI
ncbi:hypothetical protein AVEN_193366-1 [Araneus ventricosus]|uniref:Ionotropic glutamate receptor C-terminal domain-containing protein n=1 Tax=Araneus ventricosus TaxID=182803 RepID=A0A4Y2J9Q2_ARAVE|nr:hypothetical protein AVEN_193366-1 [Araneus ventricosus]